MLPWPASRHPWVRVRCSNQQLLIRHADQAMYLARQAGREYSVLGGRLGGRQLLARLKDRATAAGTRAA
jgi:GGDEF domain-containing protein